MLYGEHAMDIPNGDPPSLILKGVNLEWGLPECGKDQVHLRHKKGKISGGGTGKLKGVKCKNQTGGCAITETELFRAGRG